MSDKKNILIRTTLAEDKSNFLFFMRLMKGDMKRIVLINLLYATFSGLIPSFVLRLERKVYSIVNLNDLNKTEEVVLSIVGLIATMYVLKIIVKVFDYIRNYFEILNGERLALEIDKKILQQYSTIPIENFDSAEFFELASKAGGSGIYTLDRILQNLFGIYRAFITLISLFLVLPLSYYWITIFSVLSALVGYYAMNKTNDARQEYREKTNLPGRRREYYRNVCVNPNNLDELKIYDNGFLRNKYLKGKDALYETQMALNFKLNFWDSGFLQLKGIVCKISYIFLIYDVCMGSITIDYFILISVALEGISDTLLWDILYQYEWFKKISINLDYIKRFFSIPTEYDVNTGTSKPKEGHHTICFENVSFKYPNTDVEVLKNVNFTLENGRKIALVGLNGSGKTTWIKLLLKLYAPTEGAIYLDGMNINDYDVDDYRKMFGVLFQDYCKYAFSLKENIALFNEMSSEEEQNLKKILRSCSLEDFIESLPEKESTWLTRLFKEESLDVSEGQWQKIALARALYFKKSFIILDEPTAYFDVQSEKVFFDELFDKEDDTITMIVTHQLSIASRCDKIILLDEGELIEFGSHEELMEQGGRYYELFKKQSHKYLRK